MNIVRMSRRRAKVYLGMYPQQVQGGENLATCRRNKPQPTLDSNSRCVEVIVARSVYKRLGGHEAGKT
jgi:hypothetical protein